ncbi:hypothetical protein E4U56_000025 [Claviceps arundinis]|uniref:Uncharacterized protein n=1 Tax=Claviceps arundinis TaxID=1623583 RepID=A0A9P7SV81_9HYPO|nr:hypothetical protein E4U56_000025 [Claviceps arundinis]
MAVEPPRDEYSAESHFTLDYGLMTRDERVLVSPPSYAAYAAVESRYKENYNDTSYVIWL